RSGSFLSGGFGCCCLLGCGLLSCGLLSRSFCRCFLRRFFGGLLSDSLHRGLFGLGGLGGSAAPATASFGGGLGEGYTLLQGKRRGLAIFRNPHVLLPGFDIGTEPSVEYLNIRV